MLNKNKHVIILFTSSTLLLLMLITVMNPVSGGPIAIVGFLLLVFLVVYAATLTLFNYFEQLKVGNFVVTKSGKKYASLAISIGITYLLGLSSVGQLQVIDVLLVVLFEVMAIFYILRRL